MYITHEIEIDLTNPGAAPRIQMKQGDVMSHILIIRLFANGEPWEIPASATAVIRYCAHDPQGLTLTRGVYDTLEDGSTAYMTMDNTIEVTPVGSMVATAGLVTVDVVLIDDVRQLATFNFEIYVNQAPALGTDIQNAGYYRVASLEAINAELDTLRAAITAMGGGEYLV